jgi:hypothetical protein
MSDSIALLTRMSVASVNDDAFQAWLSGADALDFLRHRLRPVSVFDCESVRPVVGSDVVVHLPVCDCPR